MRVKARECPEDKLSRSQLGLQEDEKAIIAELGSSIAVGMAPTGVTKVSCK
jgi:hypothetical protein